MKIVDKIKQSMHDITHSCLEMTSMNVRVLCHRMKALEGRVLELEREREHLKDEIVDLQSRRSWCCHYLIMLGS